MRKEPYLEHLSGATPLFQELITPLLQQKGSMTFRDFMEQALYHPDHGYYTSAEKKRTGKSGDFFTSVSVGSCFGYLLAHRISLLWEKSGSPSSFYINEWGAEEAHLAEDILNTLQNHFPSLYEMTHYQIIEPFPAKSSLQLQRLKKNHANKFSIHSEVNSAKTGFGVTLANELIDALPVHLIRKQDGHWQELHLAIEENDLTFIPKAPSKELNEEIQHLHSHLDNVPDGYTTEICLQYSSMITELISPLKSGQLLIIDYGHEQEDYYAPHRVKGTLQSYYKHQALDAPLLHPGLQDLTVHVNFSRLIELALSKGLELTSFKDQASYLTSPLHDGTVIQSRGILLLSKVKTTRL